MPEKQQNEFFKLECSVLGPFYMEEGYPTYLFLPVPKGLEGLLCILNKGQIVNKKCARISTSINELAGWGLKQIKNARP